MSYFVYLWSVLVGLLFPERKPKSTLSSHGVRLEEWSRPPRRIRRAACALANDYLLPEFGGHGDEHRGITEKSWDAGTMKQWFSHAGTRLFAFTDERTGEVLGFILACLPGDRMDEELMADGASVTEVAIGRHNERYGTALTAEKTVWVYYMHLHHRFVAHGESAACSVAFAEWCLNHGYLAIVADYMIPTNDNLHVCKAGQGIMEHTGFRRVGLVYDNSAEDEFRTGQVPLQRFEVVACDIIAAATGDTLRHMVKLCAWLELKRLRALARKVQAS